MTLSRPAHLAFLAAAALLPLRAPQAAPPAPPIQPAPACPQQVDALQSWLDGLLEAPGQTPQPPESSIEEDLQAYLGAPSRDQDRLLIDIMWDLTEPCPSASIAFGLLARSAGDEKLAVLVEHLPRGVAACGCAIDIPALRSFMWELDQRLNPELQDEG